MQFLHRPLHNPNHIEMPLTPETSYSPYIAHQLLLQHLHFWWPGCHKQQVFQGSPRCREFLSSWYCYLFKFDGLVLQEGIIFRFDWFVPFSQLFSNFIQGKRFGDQGLLLFDGRLKLSQASKCSFKSLHLIINTLQRFPQHVIVPNLGFFSSETTQFIVLQEAKFLKMAKVFLDFRLELMISFQDFIFTFSSFLIWNTFLMWDTGRSL